MSEIRKPLIETLDAVRKGDIPLDTAQQVHLIAHRHVMDRYADDREARRIGDENLRQQVKETSERIAKL